MRRSGSATRSRNRESSASRPIKADRGVGILLTGGEAGALWPARVTIAEKADVADSSPYNTHGRIRSDKGIAGYQRHILCTSLSNKHSIKRIFVNVWQAVQFTDVLFPNRKRFQVDERQYAAVPPLRHVIDVQNLFVRLDRDFPI